MKKSIGFCAAALAFGFMGVLGNGCSSSTTVVPDSSDAKSDAKVVGEAGPGADGAVSCPGANPAATDLSFNPPKARNPTACTQADLQALDANFSNTSLSTFEDLKKGLSATCVTCAFSMIADANWGVIVEADATGATGLVNFGACYASYSGQVACGQATQFLQECDDAVCQSCDDSASDGTDTQACQSGPGVQQCGAVYNPQTACTVNTDTIDDLCGNAVNGVAWLCSATLEDGGAFPGSDDGGDGG